MKRTIPDIFARQVKQIMVQREITLMSLARTTGLSHSELSYWINGHRGLRLAKLAKVTEALGLDLVAHADTVDGPAAGTRSTVGKTTPGRASAPGARVDRGRP